MKRLLLLLVLPLVPRWAPASPAGAERPPRRLDAFLEELRASHGQPALAAAVVAEEGILALGAAGVRKLGSPNRAGADDRFHVGSCTKSMTASAIATLVEEGKLDWGTTIADGLPELSASIDPAFKQVTLRDLLTHHAGVPPYTSPDREEKGFMDGLRGTPVEKRLAFARHVLGRPPVAEPRTRMIYSNAGYAVAACLAEKAAGRSWESLLEERLFRRLKMTGAGFGWPATVKRPDEPWGHSRSGPGDRLLPQPPGAPYKLPACLAPAGDVHMTIGDFARYARLHLLGLRGRDTLLRAETVRRLHTPAGGYAMGWIEREIAGERASWHNGSAGTFFAWITIWPRADLAVVVAVNSGSGEAACEAATLALAARFLSREKRAPRDPAQPGGEGD